MHSNFNRKIIHENCQLYSHWNVQRGENSLGGEKLSSVGFTPFCCDDQIEAKLEPFLKEVGFRGIEDVAKWMGQPYEPQSPQNQDFYLREERQVMIEVIQSLECADHRYVIDTTGSVIYTGQEVLSRLKELTTIVLLDAPESLQEELYRKYLANPKPVIWANQFIPLEGEEPQATLARCYPLLLKSRNVLYRELADITLDYHELHSPDFKTRTFLEKLGMS